MTNRDNGRPGFGFGRLLSNAFLNAASATEDGIDMSPRQKDLMFTYQLTLTNPKALGPEAFHYGGICSGFHLNGFVD
jgi:hypothetical protein